VEKVLKNLDRKIFHVPLHFIGRDHLVKYINSWLQDGAHGAAIAILYGIGGVGKTAVRALGARGYANESTLPRNSAAMDSGSLT